MQQIKSLEYTAAELQRKVSSLQEEKAALEEMLLTPRHDAPHATSNERERAEVLTLKVQLGLFAVLNRPLSLFVLFVSHTPISYYLNNDYTMHGIYSLLFS